LQVTWQPETNQLRLALAPDTQPTNRRTISGTLDVATRGRLTGLELRGVSAALFADWPGVADTSPNSVYLAFTLDGDDALSRAAEIPVTLELDARGRCVALALPRRGPTYEIAYPSGNQCWLESRQNGESTWRCDVGP
jgi:hypothetical protein